MMRLGRRPETLNIKYTNLKIFCYTSSLGYYGLLNEHKYSLNEQKNSSNGHKNSSNEHKNSSNEIV